jgi:hypothetical protein
MSIVAMKRKSRGANKPVSKNVFSLNGGYRNIGIIGQTNLMRSHKSCGSNDPTIIKTSIKNTAGHISSAFTHPICADGNYPIISTKSYTPENQSQGIYIENLVKNIHRDCSGNISDAGLKKHVDGCNNSVYIGSRKILRKHYTKDLDYDMSAKEYMQTRLLKNNCLPLPDNAIPVSKRWINGGGCSN